MYANVVLRIWDQNRSRRLGNLTKVKHSTEYEITVKCIHKKVILRSCTATKSFEANVSILLDWEIVIGYKIAVCNSCFLWVRMYVMPYTRIFIVEPVTRMRKIVTIYLFVYLYLQSSFS